MKSKLIGCYKLKQNLVLALQLISNLQNLSVPVATESELQDVERLLKLSVAERDMVLQNLDGSVSCLNIKMEEVKFLERL